MSSRSFMSASTDIEPRFGFATEKNLQSGDFLKNARLPPLGMAPACLQGAPPPPFQTALEVDWSQGRRQTSSLVTLSRYNSNGFK
jgi:hypothetical protein